MQHLTLFERLSPIAAVLLLAACATAPQAPARLGLRLVPAALGETISVQQQLTVERAGTTNDLVAALEVDPQHVSLVGLAMGMRVLSLDFDGREVKEWRHAMLPSQVRAADVLEDLQLTLWPLAEIARALPPGWTIVDDGLRRTLSRDGAVVATVSYSTMPRWQGTAVLDNVRYGYRLTVVSATE
ncbi:DUF3261 domain-containing protein [Massilia aurea]|uniref:DUF3261 domain-containing protein n=1 Tax=Massilia aurea TaxID=373040 RepID=UPI003461E15E